MFFVDKIHKIRYYKFKKGGGKMDELNERISLLIDTLGMRKTAFAD